MSQCVQKLPHSCGSRDALQVFADDDGNLTGYCFSCGTYVHDPLGQGKTLDDIPEKQRLGKTKEQIAEEFATIANCKPIDLKDRKLRKAALEYYGIKIGVSEQDGKTPTYHFYPYTKEGELVAYKVRHIETKNMWTVGNQRDVDLFGWEQAIGAGVKRLIITEGELDCVALRRILEIYTKEQYIDNMPAVCSLPHGAGAAGRDLARLMPKIRKHFKEISFCFDDDAAGHKAIEDACKLVPDATVITLPCKDANACLIEGKGKAAFSATQFNAAKPKNSRLVWGMDVHEEAKEQAGWGLSYPWKGLTEKTRGIRFGETIYLGAGEKIGKSEIVNALGAHLIKEHNIKIMVAKPEEANKKTYKLMAGKMEGRIFHDPKVQFDEAAYERAGELLKTHLCMLNLYQNVDWDTLKADIACAASEGVKAVFIDPITNLTNGMASSEINTALQGISQELATMAKDLDIVIFIFCHLNKPPKGSTPWDRGGKITTDYFAGSSAMARSCNYAIGMEGNKDPELSEEERNMRKLVLLADREYGESGEITLYWDKNTSLFNEATK